MERNGSGEKQWGPGLRTECVEDGMGLKDIYKDIKARMWQLTWWAIKGATSKVTPLCEDWTSTKTVFSLTV